MADDNGRYPGGPGAPKDRTNPPNPQEIDESGFAAMHDLARKLTTDDFVRESPPVDVWNRIAEATQTDSVTELATWRRPSTKVSSMVAAAVMVLAIGALGFAFTRGPAAPEIAGETTLVSDGLPVTTAATAAVDLILVDGEYQLEIDLTAIPDPGDDVLELWIIDENVEGMFSLGYVDGNGRFELPGGIEPADFPIVDISVEPLDGDPAHSGQSVLRGVLDIADA